ncbi:levansucrase [Acrocarpospora pleiomorpha]|uniref:Levansucrase n=1 Tax=Acrocarpospora pleiomorpha TaxID=90975 RepID=A0A5M3X810_9ACTN|nr:glycoside hydrolase family 68 protein [Acrocarpospora pleiomorpha]GES17244.1 levansucrase [Acrocarpospora pleiomorpha]
MTTLWTRSHLDLITEDPATTAPLILGAVPRLLPDLDIWDMWPIQQEDGTTALFNGHEHWMGLTAPILADPEARHDVARIRLLSHDGTTWTDLGDVFPDGVSPGSREWSGTAIRAADGTIRVFYTAAGHRGEPRPTFVQRVVEAPGHREIVRNDGLTYLKAEETEGGPGRIRAFRDPAWFRDPADGRAHLLIAASVSRRGSRVGAIALASDGWTLRPPLLVADGVNREIERPHVIWRDGLYYLFFCTHAQSFHPPGKAPTGLYGFAAPTLTGPYEPLNGSGLVIGNPTGQPDQAYAWMVLDDLRAVSFLNYRPEHGFGGTLAPILRLRLDGLTTTIE